MPIGITSDTEFEQELDRLSGKTRPSGKVTILPPVERGRKEGDVNVPDSLRKIIGESSVIDGRNEALSIASDFGISASSVSAYAKGATSTTSYNQPKSDIVSHINKSRHRAIKRAGRTLNQALSSLTQDKLDNATATDLSGIAKDMSVIIKNLEPKNESESNLAQPNFVIYAPQFKKEENFEFIQVNE